MKLTPEERNEINNQLLLVGQLVGASWRVNPALLRKWLESEDLLSDFRYRKQVEAVIKFTEEAQ